MDTPRKQYPAVRGLSWHRAQYYSFYTPMDWHRFAWPDDRQGEIYGPDADDPLTGFAVEVRDLGTEIKSDDLDTLAEGFFKSLEQLPACEVQSRSQRVTGNLLELEAKYTFQEEGETRKYWVRVFYHRTRQIVMAARGATPAKYDYWLPWFFEAMMTAKVHSQKPREP